MGSQRLTKALRIKILDAAIEQTLKERIEALITRERELADRLYEHFLGTFEPAMKALPDGFFQTMAHIAVMEAPDETDEKAFAYSGRHHLEPEHWYYRSRGQFELSQSRLVPEKYRYRAMHVFRGSPLADAIRQLDDDFRVCGEDKVVLSKKLKANLNAYNTVARLLKDHEYFAPYIPKEQAVTQALTVPAAEVESLMTCMKKRDDCVGAA